MQSTQELKKTEENKPVPKTPWKQILKFAIYLILLACSLVLLYKNRRSFYGALMGISIIFASLCVLISAYGGTMFCVNRCKKMPGKISTRQLENGQAITKPLLSTPNHPVLPSYNTLVNPFPDTSVRSSTTDAKTINNERPGVASCC